MVNIVIIALCILLNAFLAGTETAFVATRKSIIRLKVEEGIKKARLLLRLRENPERTLSVIQVGITFLGALASAVGGALAKGKISIWILSTFHLDEPLSEILSILLVVIPITYTSVVIGELVPKTIALRNPDFFALKASVILHSLSLVFYPIVLILEKSTRFVIKLLPKKNIPEEIHKKEQILKLDVISKPTQKYVFNIVKIERITVSEILLKWEDTTTVELSQTINEVEHVALMSGHTRIPVTKEGKVVGIINTKELMVLSKANETNWSSIIRETIFVKEDMPILAALRLMQEKRMLLVIVLSNNQKILGIVTLEEIFEEIVGDIYDEDDYSSIRKLLTRQFK